MEYKPESRGHWIWPLMLAVVVFFASGRSSVASPGWVSEDKIAHLLVFGLLGILIARTQPKKRWWWGIILASLYGAADEWRQSFTPGRFVEFGDWAADTVGAVLAVTLYRRWSFFRNKLEQKIWPSSAVPVANGAGMPSDLK